MLEQRLRLCGGFFSRGSHGLRLAALLDDTLKDGIEEFFDNAHRLLDLVVPELGERPERHVANADGGDILRLEERGRKGRGRLEVGRSGGRGLSHVEWVRERGR